jgi:hypothetical protein
MNKQEDDTERINRRDFVQAIGLGTAVLLTEAIPGRQSATAATPVFKGIPSNTRRAIADLEIALRATAAEVSLFPGAPTRVWVYQGEVLQGDPASLQTIQDLSLRYPAGLAARVSASSAASGKTALHILRPDHPGAAWSAGSHQLH